MIIDLVGSIILAIVAIMVISVTIAAWWDVWRSS